MTLQLQRSTQKPRFAEDYVTVNERLAAFMEKYPEGSLQSEIIGHTESRVTVRAIAYRTPDDARPGIGHSSLGIPGATPYTRGSELENCETSAWGRALAALGFEVKRGIATQNEIDAKRTEEHAPVATPTTIEAPTPAPSGDPVAEVMGRSIDAAKEVSTPAGIAAAKTFLHEHRYESLEDFKARGAADALALLALLREHDRAGVRVPAGAK